MIYHIRPIDILLTQTRRDLCDPLAWYLYMDFVAKCNDWNKQINDGRGHFQVMNDTSSINNHEPWPISSDEGAYQRLAKLFSGAGNTWADGEFLRFCGIYDAEDLLCNYRYTVRKPTGFATRKWFDVYHRRMLKSHNSCHPDAVWACGAYIQLNRTGDLWKYAISYSYEWDSSSWEVALYQRRRESLCGFAKRVDQFIDEILGTEDFHQEGSRHALIRDREEIQKSISRLFYTNHDASFEESYTNKALSVAGFSLTQHRICLTKSQKRTLFKWIGGNS